MRPLAAVNAPVGWDADPRCPTPAEPGPMLSGRQVSGRSPAAPDDASTTPSPRASSPHRRRSCSTAPSCAPAATPGGKSSATSNGSATPGAGTRTAADSVPSNTSAGTRQKRQVAAPALPRSSQAHRCRPDRGDSSGDASCRCSFLPRPGARSPPPVRRTPVPQTPSPALSYCSDHVASCHWRSSRVGAWGGQVPRAIGRLQLLSHTGTLGSGDPARDGLRCAEKVGQLLKATLWSSRRWVCRAWPSGRPSVAIRC